MLPIAQSEKNICATTFRAHPKPSKKGLFRQTLWSCKPFTLRHPFTAQINFDNLSLAPWLSVSIVSVSSTVSNVLAASS